jgi:hypothetical protein
METDLTPLIVVGGIYLLPTIIAMYRGNLNKGSVFVINLFFGWTVAGWFVSLVIAASGETFKNAERLSRIQAEAFSKQVFSIRKAEEPNTPKPKLSLSERLMDERVRTM